MTQKQAEALRSIMLEVLRDDIVAELASQMEIVNAELKEKIGKDLRLKVEEAVRLTDEKYQVKVSGISLVGGQKKLTFCITWMEHTCPHNFHLWHVEHDGEHYGEVLPVRAKSIAKIMAIWVYASQILGILDRQNL